MSNEKMREEFEAWFCSTMPYKIAKESWFAIMDDGDYIITDVQAGWAGWKASRAALCVELPMEYKDQFNELSYSAPAVINAILDAGVKYK